MTRKKQSKFWPGLKYIFGGILLLALIQLFASHRLATAGKLVAEIEAEAAVIKTQNDYFIEDLDRLSSLTNISGKARGLGFIPAGEVLYLAPQIPVALGR
ncbi:MAG: hypothetical protein JW991_03115 [Candidatus Pacebacteria bacterium]|nr:hypothetical protein [Candidatus Paceibacterota bacterium]